MPRERLGELLLRSGLLTQAQLVGALREQQRTGVRLGQILVDHGLLDEATLYDALARITGIERFNLRAAILERSALALVTSEHARENGVIPFKIDVPQRTLYVAITDPTNLAPVDELSFRLGLKPKLQIASETEIDRIVRHHFFGDPLDRDPRSAQRPNAPQKQTIEIEDGHIMRGMDVMRDEVLRQHPTWEDRSHGLTQSSPSYGAPQAARQAFNGLSPHEGERTALVHLKPVFDAQEDAARALRAIFELCIARGVLTREEYLDRLKRTPD